MPHIVQKKQEEAQDKEGDCSLSRRKNEVILRKLNIIFIYKQGEKYYSFKSVLKIKTFKLYLSN